MPTAGSTRIQRLLSAIALVILATALPATACLAAEGESKVPAADTAKTPVAKPPATATVTAVEKPGPQTAVYPKPSAQMEPLARSNPLELLRTALQWHDQTIADYTCEFHKIEQIDGKLRKPETMHMKFRNSTFSVYLKWLTDPSRDQEVIYVEGANKGQAWVHPSGILGLIFRKVSVDPLSKSALKHSRRPITMAGMGSMLRLVATQCEEAQAKGDLKLTFEGVRIEAARPHYVFRRALPKDKGYACETLIIFIDQENLLCTRTDAYDWGGDLLSHYSYTDIVVNPGLSDDDFDPDNRKYAFRLF